MKTLVLVTLINCPWTGKKEELNQKVHYNVSKINYIMEKEYEGSKTCIIGSVEGQDCVADKCSDVVDNIND